ncbi:nucleotidyltransferase domain-containing protein [Butyrivibrio sp. XPD2002]|uniref:nucleotidyltransferase domain-containing protein n=1 Tax=Butyrivibrio sp. XPD2002 TaxID=1280665 RepID=UPI000427880E|nr:nucleotidyltransferase family protein [Butyrivibrio sp. XPD2002]
MNEKEKLIYQFIELQEMAAGSGPKETVFDNPDWDMLIWLSKRNKCGLLFNNVVNKNPEVFHIDDETLDKWNSDSKKEFVEAYNMFNEFKRVMTAFDENNIDVVILKGYVLAALYPSIFQRYSSDLDIKLEPEDKMKVRKVLTRDLGFVWDEADSKENVDIYYNNDLKIEAHYTLWEDYEGENIEILKAERMDDPATLIDVDVAEGVKVKTLGITEHLILQMFHIVKHYILEGIESRYFCDIAFFVNKYQDEIDYNRFWTAFEKMHFDEFCVIYFTECIKHFGMTDKALAGRKQQLPEDELAFLNDIIFLGKRDVHDNADYSLLGILSPYVNGGKKSAESRKGRALQALFPSVQDIDKKYSYCKKYPILLPIAWVHRAFRTIFFKLTKGGKVYGAGRKLKESEYRIQMMKNAGIK